MHPTQHQAEKKQILITGATGYIGRKLKQRLLNRSDLKLRLLVRDPTRISAAARQGVETIKGDTFDQGALQNALTGIDTAFYLIHSMGSKGDYASKDRLSAANFRAAAEAAKVKKIVYLGGLGEREDASEHLLSRIETGEILSPNTPSGPHTLWLRAGVILGAGSASFNIIQDLARKLPLMITPKWVTTKTQPIAVDDVLRYLEASIDLDLQENLQVDIGTDITNFKGLMRQAAKSMGLKRWLLPLPFFSPRLSSYWLVFITKVPFSIASALVDGLKSETIATNNNAAKYFPAIHPMSMQQAFEKALRETAME
ncbi:MAG: NAD(P)H-binding protein [Desulfuromonadaceae bacterium]|nr:NAD(P)H-binding protein [Desulfuromonas sp.]MDY0213285.1 NAD(P)H-binding protein [Desulfuromonadaceae bacterium]